MSLPAAGSLVASVSTVSGEKVMRRISRTAISNLPVVAVTTRVGTTSVVIMSKAESIDDDSDDEDDGIVAGEDGERVEVAASASKGLTRPNNRRENLVIVISGVA